MRYQIKLRIHYEYESPVAHARHLICVLPKAIPGVQTLFKSRLAITPTPDETLDRIDHFGNAVTEIGFRTPHDGITLEMQAQVERTSHPASGPSLALEQMPAVLAQSREVLGDAPLNFVSPSARVAFDPAISSFARSVVTPGSTTTDAVIAVGRALHRYMTFDPDATDVDTPSSLAFRNRRGVCQDFSHIMIGALRALGVPCCYVSGYLRTVPPEGKARLEGADAMHAWVRAWCGPEAGWIEFDPTNDTIGGQDHVVSAIGRDYSDVSPIKGVVRMSGGQKSRQSVDVIPL